MKNSTFLSKFLTLIISILFISQISNAATITITVQSNFFSPASITNVNVGDTVKWQWVNGFHNTTSNTIPAGATSWTAPMDAGSPSFSYVVAIAGTYNYECTFHSGMTGSFTATASGGNGSLLTENFAYPAGDSLGAHGWVSFSGGSTNVLSVTAPGMTYAGYPLSNIGNATTLAVSGQDAYLNFSQPDSTGSMYTSFMVKVNTAQIGDYFFAFLPPTSTTLYTSRFYAKDSSGSLAFGLSKSTAAAGGIFYTGGNYSYGTTYLVVLKYQFNPGTTTDDAMSAFIFATGLPSTEPSTATIGPITGTAGDNTLGRIALRQGGAASAATVNIDGFKVTTSWNGIVTGVNNISNNVSDNFSLRQNYPNPFNPNTNIEFTLPENGFVNLTVFNSLGKEVESLVNENVNSGTYNVSFNGSNLNSGVYFYKLSYLNRDGKSFTETKKLILLK
ncbi:MAG TPA: T9SS type A sorting domain-containing protein [Ignavibacteria bacterium]|nr:T9SS type A sorting domain-containing protein [Ignavibacteria bacterium]